MPTSPRPRSERGILRREAEVFGTSVLGAPLSWWPAEREPSGLLVVAGVHGEEGDSVVVLSAALRSLPEGALAADVVLALNPDGLARGTRGNARGVDLNRNLPASNWSPDPVTCRWTVDDPRDVALSPGEAPGSEAETRAFLELLARRAPRIVLSLHAPLACIDDPARTLLGGWLSCATALERVSDIGYPTPGSLGTWAAEQDLPVVTWELPPDGTESLVTRHAPLLMEILAGEVPLP